MTSSTLSQISIYPIKSSAGIDLSSSWVDNIGLPFDRRFVVCDNKGQFITARTLPKLCLIQTNLTPTGLILTAPDMPILTVDYHQCVDEYQHVTVWKDTILGQRCEQNVDLWFSQYIGKPCHLLFFGEQSSRVVSNSTNPVAFADGYPLLLISQASLDELNSRLDSPVGMKQFRPNLVVDDCTPFAEDTWKHIRIGEVEFELSKPCSRCIFTTINPLTGDKHQLQEPLATLKDYRQVTSGDVMFGQNLIPLNKGQVRLGDSVTVLSTQSPPAFNPPKKRITKGKAKLLTTTVLICEKIINETHDVKTFVFKHKDIKATELNTVNSNSINYIAGQHLPFKLTINGKSTNAVYTLSSSPTRPNTLQITVKRVEGGKVSNYLHDHFNQGDEITAMPPNGQFNLSFLGEKPNDKKVLLLSAGSGVTPMLSMLRAMTDAAWHTDIEYFHSARSKEDIIAFDEVNALATQQGHCRVHYTLTQSAKPDWQGHQGHLNTHMLSCITDLTQREVFVCGPEGFREQARTLLMDIGLPKAQFHLESFGKRVSKNSAPAEEHVSSAEASEKPIPEQVNILFDSWDTNHPGNSKETLLDQGEAAGLILPYSCRGGMCGSCKVKLESGEVKQLADDGLMQSEKDAGYILACSCIPQSDVVISKA